MEIEELKPIGENLIYGAYKKFKWEPICFEDIRIVLLFAIILNIRNEYVTKFIIDFLKKQKIYLYILEIGIK